MSYPKKNIRITVIVLLAFVSLIAGFFVSLNWKTTQKVDPGQFEATILKKPRQVTPFSLTGTDGKEYSVAQLQGKWTLMFFGFTSCGSICPVTMAELAHTYKLLEQEAGLSLPQVVMVSLDPERDTLDRLKAYVETYNPHFYGARGTAQAVKSMAKTLGIVYEKTIPSDQLPEHYDIQHSGTIMLFNPQGQLAGFFSMPHKAKLIAKDYKLLTANWK